MVAVACLLASFSDHSFCLFNLLGGGGGGAAGGSVFLCPRRNRPSVCPSVRQSVRYKSCLSDISLTTKANLMKLRRKIKDIEKVCLAHNLGSYTQGQGHNQVKGQIVLKLCFL